MKALIIFILTGLAASPCYAANKLHIFIKVTFPDNEVKNYEYWSGSEYPNEIPIGNSKAYCFVLTDENSNWVELSCGTPNTDIIYSIRIGCSPKEPANGLSISHLKADKKNLENIRIVGACEIIKHR